jgi:SAM-dependent methyltransferase
MTRAATLHLDVPSDYALSNVSRVVSENDEMFDSSYHYLDVGESARQNIEAALKAGGVENVSTILDMPCGHGRVARILRARFPEARIAVSDLDVDGVAFCAREFGAEALTSSADFSTLTFGKSFDLIWVGSLITHLPARATARFIGFVVRHLSPQGVAVVSSHGRLAADRLSALGGSVYTIEDGEAARAVEAYEKAGYGYANYPSTDRYGQSYGISVASRDWITSAVSRAGGKVLFYREQAWDNHQDVVAFKRDRRLRFLSLSKWSR